MEKPTEHWYEKAADAIVREGKTLFQYANEANLGITSKECENIVRTKKFQEVLRVRRNIYHKEVANDSTLTRTAVKGQMIVAINKLMELGSFDKAVTAMVNLAKLEGWMSDGTQVNVFQDLTAADLAKLRAKFQAAKPDAGEKVH